MNKLDLYKQFYFKELSVKTELNNAVNLPIAVLTGVVSLHLFIYSREMNIVCLSIIKIISGANFFAVACCIFFLFRSFFNIGKSFYYSDFTGMNEYYEYAKKMEGKEAEFEKEMEKKFAGHADKNFKINTYRTEQLAKAKQALFISLVLSFISSTVFIISLITKN